MWRRFLTALVALWTATAACGPAVEAPDQPRATPTASARTATPHASPAVTESEIGAPWRLYTSLEGRFSISYPPGYTVFDGERPSVDGVLVPLPGGASFRSPDDVGLLLTIERLAFEGGGALSDLVAQDGCGLDPTQGQELALAGASALLFPDTLCGPFGSSRIFLVAAGGGYRIVVESTAGFEEIHAEVLALLGTFSAIDTGK